MASGGDHDPVGLIAAFIFAIGNHHRTGRGDTRAAFKPRDLVFLEQKLNPAGQIANNILF